MKGRRREVEIKKRIMGINRRERRRRREKRGKKGRHRIHRQIGRCTGRQTDKWTDR